MIYLPVIISNVVFTFPFFVLVLSASLFHSIYIDVAAATANLTGYYRFMVLELHIFLGRISSEPSRYWINRFQFIWNSSHFMLLWNYSNFSWLISSLVGIIPISVLDRRCSLWAAAAWCSIVVFFGVIICWFNWGYDCYVWSGFDWMFYEKIVGYKEILRNYDMHDRGSVCVSVCSLLSHLFYAWHAVVL